MICLLSISPSVNTNILEETSDGLIVTLYFKHIFTLEPECPRVALIVIWEPWTAPHQLPEQRKEGVQSWDQGCGLCIKKG